MDVWAWVHKLTDDLEQAGQDRAASLFYRFSDHVVAQEIPQAEALLPEALAMARTMKNPWAEVFFRHWEMRLRLGVKGEGQSALADVVDLLDFAHSKACEGCPQTMCTTQDIASCYANIDGPGWAEERRALALEGLDRIDPGWNCYGCLSHEYALALCDEKRYAEALAFWERYENAITGWGRTHDSQDFMFKADILHGLGRDEEALALLDRAAGHEDMRDDIRRRMRQRLSRAAVLSALGRTGEAWDVLPGWDEIPPGYFAHWLLAAGDLALARPEYNTWGLGSCFQAAMEHLSGAGAHRAVLDVGHKGVELALRRGSYATPRRLLRLMRRHLPRLRYPLGADAMLEDLEKTVSEIAPPPLPVPPDTLLKHLKEINHPDAEQGLDWLFVAMEALPGDAGLVNTACSALAAMNAEAEARELLWTFIWSNPENSEDAVDAFIRHTTREHRTELCKLADFIAGTLPHMAHWIRLYVAYRERSLPEVEEHAKRYIKLRPKAVGARMIWANTAMTVKDFSQAGKIREELVAICAERDEQEANSHRWDLLVAATCAGNWKLVRDTCIGMGFDEEPGDTPIDDPGQFIRIRYMEEGREMTALAQRNGPVTARIISGFWPSEKQRTRDLVVFEPELLEPYPEDEEERRFFYPPYRLVHTLEKGNYRSWLVDGFYPGQEAFGRLRGALEEQGCSIDSRCDAEYTIADPHWEGKAGEIVPDNGAGQEVPFPPPGRLDGIYFLLSAPADFPPAQLDAILTRETHEWTHPLCWLDLAKAAGRAPEKHQAIIERYRL